ncbi:MAG: sulfite exporter TauE/SafE family protein [Caldilineaceae bacterium]|nr:sulfite exporter TauE/SafE family protein [Caldilineaceae bacterium]
MTAHIMAVAALWLALLLVTPSAALAHPLGNFTVNRYSRLSVSGEEIRLTYVVDMAEIPTHQERSRMDRNGDHTVDRAEQDAYVADWVAILPGQLSLHLNGRPQAWRLEQTDLTFPIGQAGLPTLRLVTQWTTSLAAQPGPWQADYRDTSYADRLGWQEIVVQATAGATLEAASVPSADVSQELRIYPDNLLQSPLAVSQATFRFTRLAADSRPNIQPSGTMANAPARAGRPADPFAELINIESLRPFTILLALLAAFGWGAAHAFSPGHGKTLAGAYLIGSRGTAWHALLLGITTTITHTAGVLALGGVTLFAAQFILPEQLFPWLSITSGVLVAAIGVIMIRERGRTFLSRDAHPSHSHTHHSRGHAPSPTQAHHHDHGHDHHEYSHDSAHSHDHTEPMHLQAHPHAHLPPGADGSPVTWRSLLALGVSGGLLPCPSALVLMLGAISVQRVAFGLALIVMFSLGLASVLTAIGIALVYAGRFFRHIPEGGPLFRFVPVASALFITVAGLGITIQALMQFGLLTLS